MIIDCMTCPVRGQRCDGCVVTVLRGFRSADHLASPELRLSSEPASPLELQLDAAEHRAVSMFVSAGLVTAGAVARLRANREGVQQWGTVRVG